MVAEVPCADKQAAMPEGIDGRRRRVEAQRGAGVADIFETEGHAEETDRSAREARDDGKGEPLLQGVGGGHFVQFTCASRQETLWKRFKKTSGRTLLPLRSIYCEHDFLSAFARGLPMRRFNQFILFSLFAVLFSGVEGNAQTALPPPSNTDVEELRQ